MKIKDIFFEETNFIGHEVETIQDVVKGMAADMDFANAEGNGYTYEEYHESDDEHDEDWYEQPTEQMIFERIKEDIDNGQKVYAGMYLDCRDFEIVPSARTTLQSCFMIGDDVYMLIDNMIHKVKILHIWLATGLKGNIDFNVEKFARELFYDVLSTIRKENVIDSYRNISTSDAGLIKDRVRAIMVREYDFAMVKSENTSKQYLVNIDKIFKTKEELVKALCNEQDNQ